MTAKSAKQNYQKELDKTIESLVVSTTRPSLLLHACCGPCSSYVLEYLANFFDITIFYYNPNIFPKEEYERRLEELKNLLSRFPAAFKNNVKVVEQNYDPEEFYSALEIKNHPEFADEPEKGERCHRCYEFRLKKAYEYAFSHNFEYFCTTLSISPFKDAEKINTIGKELCNSTKNPKWLISDFKKKGGFKRSLELSEEYNLYRQQYCGCVYSKINTEKFRSEHKS
ncbi:MAG: epoxyqueuosine reductase QueH [Treponema sp.]|nr:epoxyqueuosine reductase QueH [Treponema sp.]